MFANAFAFYFSSGDSGVSIPELEEWLAVFWILVCVVVSEMTLLILVYRPVYVEKDGLFDFRTVLFGWWRESGDGWMFVPSFRTYREEEGKDAEGVDEDNGRLHLGGCSTLSLFFDFLGRCGRIEGNEEKLLAAKGLLIMLWNEAMRHRVDDR